jgi:hypothetical protein
VSPEVIPVTAPEFGVIQISFFLDYNFLKNRVSLLDRVESRRRGIRESNFSAWRRWSGNDLPLGDKPSIMMLGNKIVSWSLE